MIRDLIERVLKRFVTDNRYATLSRSQVEAFTDTVALAMVIDRHIAELERDELTRQLSRFEWPEEHPSEHFINRSVHRAWDTLASDTPTADALTYCKDIASRLHDDWLKEAAYVAVVLVVEADDEVVEAETELLEHLQEAFDFEDERVALLRDRAHA